MPARQKSSWSDCYHQEVAVRSHWYRVIEGFLPLGRITGLEMIARFNRPLKPKGNTSAKRKRPFAPPIDPLLPSSRPLNFHLESVTSVSLWAKKAPQPHSPNLLPFHITSESSESVNLNSAGPEKPLTPSQIEDPRAEPLISLVIRKKRMKLKLKLLVKSSSFPASVIVSLGKALYVVLYICELMLVSEASVILPHCNCGDTLHSATPLWMW